MVGISDLCDLLSDDDLWSRSFICHVYRTDLLVIPSRRAGSSFVRQSMEALVDLHQAVPISGVNSSTTVEAWSDLQRHWAPASVIHRNHPASYNGVLHQTFGPVLRGDYKIAFHNDAVDNGNIGRTTRRVASRSAVFSAAGSVGRSAPDPFTRLLILEGF